MAKAPQWLVRILYLHRTTVYIVILGLAGLLTLPTIQLIPDSLGATAWGMRIGIFLLSVGVAAVVVFYLYQLAIPPRPKRAPQEMPDTAQIPAVSPPDDEDKENDELESDAESEPNLEPPRHLSRFARLRIGRQYPGLQHSSPLFEVRKSAYELFIQFNERKPIKGKRLTLRGWRQRKQPPTVIYGPALAIIFFVTLAAVAASTLPAADAAVGILLLCAALAGLRLFQRWARWYYWRFVGLASNPETGFEATIVLINMPRFFPGGGVKAMPISKINNASALTEKTEEEYDSIRSIATGVIKREWIEIDTLGQKDEVFHWVGPLVDAPQLVSIILRATHNPS